MSSVAQERLSPEEYLRRERAAETKSEYDDGLVYAMSGGSARHNLIGAGLIGALLQHMPSRCRVYTSDMRVRILKPTRYYYPDVSVVCGEAIYAEDQRDVLVNPIVVFEVLSESTMARDYGRKFLSYQAIDSLQEYVLVSQDEYLVEHYRRCDETQWVYTVTCGLDATLPLPAAGCELSLRKIYDQAKLA